MENDPQIIPTYPIGQQDFKRLREQGFIYVDKTRFIDVILKLNLQYVFLARPRRFGKSLFLSTLRYFFEGKRELFQDLHIDSIGWNWDAWPVLHLDLNSDRFATPESLNNVLENLFNRWEKEYNVTTIEESYSQRFKNIIAAAHEKTGKQVVILIDEYDKPLVANLNHNEQFEHFRSRLASIYSNFKSSAEHIRLVFLTGVSRFGKLSVFSDINNLKDITFSEEFADICGITEKELYQYFQTGISLLAAKEGLSAEEAREELKLNYDGYRFHRNGSYIYNPWSLLNAMQDSSIEDYWVRTGKPTIIAETLRNRNVDLEKILNTECRLDMLQGLDLSNADPLALLYQTGYLTIKDYDKETKLYRLGLPNQEVTHGLFSELLPSFLPTKNDDIKSIVNDILTSILKGEPEKMIKSLDSFFARIPYDMKMENENNFHNAIYILLTLLGVQVDTEVHTSDGRIDLVIKTSRFIYIIELKFGKDAATAISQIEEMQYDLPYLNDPRRLYRIGANFNTSTRRLDPPEYR